MNSLENRIGPDLERSFRSTFSLSTLEETPRFINKSTILTAKEREKKLFIFQEAPSSLAKDGIIFSAVDITAISVPKYETLQWDLTTHDVDYGNDEQYRLTTRLFEHSTRELLQVTIDSATMTRIVFGSVFDTPIIAAFRNFKESQGSSSRTSRRTNLR